MSLPSGTRLGAYEILAPLGAGGMGEVYRARDLRLGREIALKVLPAAVASDPERLARFEREARTVAGLNHPGIVTLFSVEDDGEVRFLTMELVEGAGLEREVVPGGLPATRVIALGIALADALSAAHEKGVVHRDLKPANVMLTRDGRVKVLDFGLAKLAAPDSDPALSRAVTVATPLSGEGLVLGTVPYMAPEQVRGEAVDARTDLFALGIVLYELATGARPFGGSTAADVGSAILRDVPPPLTRVRPGLPPDLERIVGRCLEKNPRERFQTSLDVANELRHLLRSLERDGPGATAAPAERRPASVAVLPFVNRSASSDDEYFSDGLADEMINALSKTRGLRVTARTSSFHFKGKDATIAEIGRALDVATVLEGSVRKAGNRIRISVQLVDVADSSHLWSETYDRTLDDIFAVQDDIARSVVAELRATLLGGPPGGTPPTGAGARTEPTPAPGAARGTDAEVYDLYLRGRHQLNRRGDENLRRAIEYFTAALARDPSYAPADLGLAEAHGVTGFHEFEPPRDAFARARAAGQRALLATPHSGEAHAVLAYVALHHDRDWSTAERLFVRAIELQPDIAVTRLWYANLLTASGRFEEALEQGRRGLELEPLSLVQNVLVGWVRFFQRDLAAACDQMARTLELEPAFFLAHQWRGWALWRMGRLAESAAELETAAGITQHPPTALGNRALAAAFTGRPDACREMVARLEAMRDERFVSGYLIALGHLATGDADAAEPWIVRAAEERSPWVGFMKVDPRVDELRGRPRIEAIIAGLGKGA